MHNLLKTNTPIKIINPENHKFIETKIYKTAKYPGIFNVVISKKISSLLELDDENPFIEIIEIKKNKTFIAKESDIFEEEINVADKAPVDGISISNLGEKKKKSKKNKKQLQFNYIIKIADFYYEKTAILMKKRIEDELKFI